MFLTTSGTSLIILYHIPFLWYVVLLRYLRWSFIPSPHKHTFITLHFLSKCNCLFSLGEFSFSWNKTFYHLYLFPNHILLRCSKRKSPFTIFGISRLLWRVFIFRLDNMFYLVSFLLSCMILRVLGKHLWLRQRNMFYHFLCFREIAFRSLHIYFLRVFVLITYLQCNIFICLKYLRRTMFLCLNNVFFRILFVTDIWKEPYYFALITCFSVFHLSQISEKNHINSPW